MRRVSASDVPMRRSSPCSWTTRVALSTSTRSRRPSSSGEVLGSRIGMPSSSERAIPSRLRTLFTTRSMKSMTTTREMSTPRGSPMVPMRNDTWRASSRRCSVISVWRAAAASSESINWAIWSLTPLPPFINTSSASAFFAPLIWATAWVV